MNELGDLGLRLVAGRTTYRAGEPLDLRVFFDNHGDVPILVMARATHVDLFLSAYDDDGDFLVTLLPPEPPPPPTAADLATVPAKGTLELTSWELLGRINERIIAGHGRTGSFALTAGYVAGMGLTDGLRRLDGSVWIGRLTSNAVVVTYADSPDR